MITLLYGLKIIFIGLLFITPIIAYMIRHKYRLSLLWVYPATSILCYLFIIGGAWATDAHLSAILQSYDLDGNGVLNDDELTPMATQAMQNVANDTGRTIAPMTGLIIAPIGVAVCFVFCGFLMIIKTAKPR
ncbi:hypothetical protein [Moraxella bovis]|uniref:EF-hand domain-containing protein n=1 Tax=Moraxella bovis TaxID=476 RepID=A0A378PQA9_MORBO|nr:hypothetical protein [Moraxella bovis]STY90654.1 Uncharacterised protein [Moraxella bovis]